jgi:hypothetical protein
MWQVRNLALPLTRGAKTAKIRARSDARGVVVEVAPGRRRSSTSLLCSVQFEPALGRRFGGSCLHRRRERACPSRFSRAATNGLGDLRRRLPA